MNNFLRIVNGKSVVLSARDPDRLYSPNSNGDHVEWNIEAEIAQRAEWSANMEANRKTAYLIERAALYPPIPDQLDALWKGGADADAMKAKIQAVKDAIPKPKEDA